MKWLISIGLVLSALGVLGLGPVFAHESSGSIGEAGDLKSVAKVIKVDVREGGGRFLFSPDRIDVPAHAVVRFVVHNGGVLEHEFVLGTNAANAAHAKMMEAMPAMKHHDRNAISLEPGATETLTWRFDRAGTFEFACLIPGHYQAGMHGVLAVR